MRNAIPPGPGGHAAAAAGMIIIATVLLSGCAAGSGPSGTAAAGHGVVARPAGADAHAPVVPAAQAPAVPAAQSLAGAASGHAGQPASTGAAGMLAAGQDIAYTASMTVDVANLSQATGRAARLAAQAGGYVSQENAAFRPAGTGRATATIQLKIPVSAYPAALSLLAGLGTQASLQQQTQDVTVQVADTASRVASDEAAIRALRAFLARAGSISELLTVQAEIDSQESALEAMQAQQRALDHETAFATVSLRLVGPAPGHQRPARRSRRRRTPAGGFIGGFTAGWKALITVVSWLLSALGAVLPIGAICALAGYLAYRGLRARRWLRRRARPAGG